MFTSSEEFIQFLRTHSKFSMNLGLGRIAKACELLNNPQLKRSTIHVGGTNGKGSTCNYLMHLLMEDGFKVGLFVSPYIETFNERIQINGRYISDQDLVDIANDLLPIINRVEGQLQESLTEFEVITLLSFVYFDQQDVDFAIYEVGLGGRFDATNVIHPMVAGITNISLEHTDVLGDTIGKIAYEKIGIAKPGLRLYTTETKEEALDVFRTAERQVGYTLLPITTSDRVRDVELLDDGVRFTYLPLELTITLPLLGYHQVENAVLALEMYRDIMNQLALPIDTQRIQSAFRQSFWPGRLEIISKNPFIILDGSHNEAGVQKLVEVMDRYRKRGYRIHTIFSALRDKDTKGMINHLDGISESICFTTFPFYRASTAHALAEKSHHPKKTICEDFRQAIEERMKNLAANDLLLVTGSLYFISQVKQFFRERHIIEELK